ncbi:MAG: MoaD/ThiS family protein [Chitinophagaceae bacterium]|nr:MoaD/ThiS family protein [Chitinophagaceae bacterium]
MTDTLTIRCFGQLTELLGGDKLVMPIVSDSDELLRSLINKYPFLLTTKFIVSIDRKVIRTKTQLTSESEIAIMPPFSGG